MTAEAAQRRGLGNHDRGGDAPIFAASVPALKYVVYGLTDGEIASILRDDSGFGFRQRTIPDVDYGARLALLDALTRLSDPRLSAVAKNATYNR